MKLLVVGDLSSAGHFLCKGFRELGVSTTHIAYQNGWRENPIEVNLTSPYKGLLGRLHNYTKPIFLKDLVGYNAILFLDYFVFPRTFGINSFAIKRLQENNGPSFLWILGCDSKFAKWGRLHNFELCNPCLLYDQKKLSCNLLKNEKEEDQLIERMTKIIPASYEYYESHKLNPKTTPPIQIAVDIDNILIEKRKKNGSLNIFHGLNRYGFKGTHIVESVFNVMRDQYSKKANFLISERMTYAKYTQVLGKQDIVVDQLFNKSLGVNSLLSLASGKVLVAGSAMRGCEAYNIPLPPMISCDPSISGLHSSLRCLIDNYNELEFNADDARAYVETHHSPSLVAKKFMRIFGW